MNSYEWEALGRFVQWWAADGEQFLTGLARRIKISNGPPEFITMTNVHLATSNDMVTPATLTVDSQSGSGWQWPVMSTGESKCIACDELNSTNHLLCDMCRRGIQAIRLAPELVGKISEVFGDPRLAHLFEMLTMENFRAYLEDAIGNLADDEKVPGE